MMPSLVYVIYGCSSPRTTPGVSLYRGLTVEEKYCCVYYSGIDDNLKRQIKNQTLYTYRLFLLT